MLALSLLLSIPIARAADQTTICGATFTEKWNFSATSGATADWVDLSVNGIRDCCFWNGELIVLTKSTKLYRINPSNGAKIGEISVSGISGGTLILTSIKVAQGKLYGCNFAQSGEFKIYRWDNTNSTPTVAATHTLASDQYVAASGKIPSTQAIGRKMGVVNNTLILTNSTHLFNFTVNADGSVSAVSANKFGSALSRGENDGSAVSIVDVNGGANRIWTFSPYGTSVPVCKTNTGGGIGVLTIDNVNATNKYVPDGKVINYSDKKFLAMINYANIKQQAYIQFYPQTSGSDIKYTSDGASRLPLTTGLGATNNSETIGALEYQIRADGTIDICMLVPLQGIAMFSTKIQEDPKAATNLKVNQTWNGGKQTAVLSWTPGENLTSYKILKGSSAADAKTEVATITNTKQSSYTIDAATLGTGSATVYCLTSYEGDKKVGNNSYFSQQDLGFGKVDLQGTLTGTTAKLTWTGPQYGEVDHYEVWQNVITNVNGKVTEEDNWVDKNVAAGTKEYTKYSYVAQKVENGKSILTSFYVKAVMKQTVTVSNGKTSNTVKSNVLSLTETGNPVIYNAIVYEGRNTATIEWEYPGVKDTHVYYDIYRNGALIKKDYEAAKFSDMNLPDGTYTYYVVGYRDDDKSSRTSNTATCTIKRNRLVTGYGLEAVYNYPIYTPEEYAAHGNPADAVVAAGPFANAKDKVGAYGAPGDAFRQAQFHNGYWYLACLTSARATDHGSGKKYIPNSWTDTEKKKTFGDVKGGILKIGARGTEGIEDPRKLKDHTWAELEVNYTWPLENQSIAISEDGRIYRRGLGNHTADLSNNGPLHKDAPACDLFYLPWQYVCQPGANGLAGRSDINLTSYTFDKRWVADGQGYRTHYISAGGNSANGTDYLLFAMNSTRDVWRVLPNGTATQFTAPTPETSIDTKCTSTENYAFPVVGRGGDFIHQVRSEGIYYVTKDGQYSRIYSEETDCKNSGGVTFKYNDEIFLLHPIGTRSNNVGHFAIDMAKKYGDDVDQASFTEMIPVASFMQEGMADFVAGNSNANWFGAEYNEKDDCIYIYQYVPGVRFAKYRLYKYLDFPGVQPTLDIKVVESPKANGSGDEVELLTAVATWQRPNETPVNEGGDGYRPDLANTEYLIGEYEVEFLDNNNTPYSGNNWNKQLYAGETGGQYNGGDAKDKDFNTSIYHGYYGKDEKGNTTQKNLKEVSHTVRVTPIYHKKSNWNVTVRGEGNIAIARADYPAGINPLEVHAYDGTKNGLGYRVDFNFNRASMEEGQYPHHVSFFTLEVSKDGGKTFDKLTNYYFIWGNGYHSPSNENFEHVYDNYGRDFNDVVRKDGAKSYIVDLIPGDYRFGNNLGEENLKDRYYYQKLNGTKNANALNKTFIAPDGTEMKECYKGLAAPDAKGECVAYYYTNENPQTHLYRAVAHYAAGNETIHKEAYTTAVAPLDMTTTGVDNIAGDNEGNLSIYPVPAESTVTINAPVGISNVKVFSLSGSLVLDVNGEGNNTQTIDVSMLTPGVYMVAVNSLTPVRMIKR